MFLSIIAIISTVLLFLILINYTKSTDTAPSPSLLIQDEPTFLVDGYPIDEVPIYKLSKVNSNTVFINTVPFESSTYLKEIPNKTPDIA
ncbi:MAG: hypothetical protein QG570_664 [Patescibacteria group bacterium]|nr:hypothetical protein [Patescibacteria group bacterium]